MPAIQLNEVSVSYRILSVADYNLKRRFLAATRRIRDQHVVINALRGVSLEVTSGARLGLVGPNGAGKSTLLGVMAGVLPPTKGAVSVQGRVLALLGGSGTGLDFEASGSDNIIRLGVQLGESPSAMRRRFPDIVEFSGLGDRISHPVYTYSSGMQARLRFSAVTALDPDILLIDEGIGMADAEFTERANLRLDEFARRAGILVLATHSPELMTRLCTTAVLIQGGEVRSSGDASHILASYHAEVDRSGPEV
jgi:ABC-2 type transport system ATP-binding protein